MQYEKDHPRIARVCLLADFSLRVFFTILLVLLVVTVVYKTVMPLPEVGG